MTTKSGFLCRTGLLYSGYLSGTINDVQGKSWCIVMPEMTQETETFVTCATNVLNVPGSVTERAGLVAPAVQTGSVL